MYLFKYALCICVDVPTEGREHVRSPGAEVTGGCEPADMGADG